MKRRTKIIIGIVLILILALCCIPVKSNNSKYRLNIVSSYGDDEAYHPKVLAFENGWNGYKYWMSYTPYPNGTDSQENPHIAVSNDLVNWKPFPGMNVSLDDISKDGIKEQYNSDSHIVYNTDTDELECYWRFVDDLDGDVTIYRRKTKDGLNWTEKEIAAYSVKRSEKDYISPAIIYENHIYKMWFVDQDNTPKFATSLDGKNWTNEKTIEIKYEKALLTWHLDVIKTENGYEMLVVAYDKWDNRNDMNLYYTKSSDGFNWDVAKTIIKPSVKTRNWDNKGIYRSSFIYENGRYYVYYGGTSRSYNHGVGFVYGEDIFNLHSVQTNFKNDKEVEKLIKELKIK